MQGLTVTYSSSNPHDICFIDFLIDIMDTADILLIYHRTFLALLVHCHVIFLNLIIVWRTVVLQALHFLIANNIYFSNITIDSDNLSLLSDDDTYYF